MTRREKLEKRKSNRGETREERSGDTVPMKYTKLDFVDVMK